MISIGRGRAHRLHEYLLPGALIVPSELHYHIRRLDRVFTVLHLDDLGQRWACHARLFQIFLPLNARGLNASHINVHGEGNAFDLLLRQQ